MFFFNVANIFLDFVTCCCEAKHSFRLLDLKEKINVTLWTQKKKKETKQSYWSLTISRAQLSGSKNLIINSQFKHQGVHRRFLDETHDDPRNKFVFKKITKYRWRKLQRKNGKLFERKNRLLQNMALNWKFVDYLTN